MISIVEIAQKAGVSKTTVSRVLNDSRLVKERTAQRVRAVIASCGYQPNELARSLRKNETKTIGVIVSNILNPFFTSIVRGIEDVANESNYNIILCNTDENGAKELHYINTLVGKQVDGLIIATTGSGYSQVTAGKPVVFVDRHPAGGNGGQYDVVLVKNAEGSYLATSHLLDSGYRRIAVITGSVSSTTGFERLLGYKQALKERGVKVDDKLIKVSDFLGNTGYRYAFELITQTDCDAIFVTNNMILLEVLKAAKELRVSFPETLGLAAFDDIEWMQYCKFHITAVRQPSYEIGTRAMELLLDRLASSSKEAREVLLDVELVIRDTSVKPGSSSNK